MDLTHRFEPGENVLAVSATNDGAAPNPAALVAWLQVEFDDGEPLVVVTDDAWKVAERGGRRLDRGRV